MDEYIFIIVNKKNKNTINLLFLYIDVIIYLYNIKKFQYFDFSH